MVSKEDMKGDSPRTAQGDVLCVLVQDFFFSDLKMAQNIPLEAYPETKDAAIPKLLFYPAQDRNWDTCVLISDALRQKGFFLFSNSPESIRVKPHTGAITSTRSCCGQL